MTKGPATTHLAQALYSWRTKQGLSQTAAAARLGISQRSLQDYERGKTDTPHTKNMQRICEELGMSREELLAGPAHTTDAIERALDSMRQEIARLRRDLEQPRKRSKPRASRSGRRSKS